jgi:prevent-host-death family protein
MVRSDYISQMDKRGVVPLSLAKAKLSELIRSVRQTGEPVTISIDGEPAARITTLNQTPERLSAAEVATFRALMEALNRIPRPTTSFDAVDLISEGRR